MSCNRLVPEPAACRGGGCHLFQFLEPVSTADGSPLHQTRLVKNTGLDNSGLPHQADTPVALFDSGELAGRGAAESAGNLPEAVLEDLDALARRGLCGRLT